VVVIGSGIAGTAAALAAARAGAEVTIVMGAPGATVLAGGALDDVPWEDARSGRGEPRALLAEDARSVLDDLEGYDVPEGQAVLVARTGIVRLARGRDRALLSVATSGPGDVMVTDVAHAGWDALALARSWSASREAAGRGLRFVAVKASVLAHTDERAFTDADLAARHDDPERLAWLAARLSEALARAEQVERVSGVVLPPWLGASRERATELSRLVGLPCGEALGGVGGPSGLRFEHARDRATERRGVRVVQGRACRVAPAEELAWHVDLSPRSLGTLDADAVVLATGGLLGGGFEYTPSGATLGGALPSAPRSLARVTLDAPVTLGARGDAGDTSSLFGGAPETHAWPYQADPLLDRLGVPVDDHGRVRGESRGLYAVGELAADRPRTWLAALSLGARAGGSAASG